MAYSKLKLSKECPFPFIGDSRIIENRQIWRDNSGKAYANIWKEEWLAYACGRNAAFTIRFVENKVRGGTTFDISLSKQ